MADQCPATLTAQKERELIDALSEMLLAAASDEARNPVEGDRSDEQQDQ
jgi:hypothetical protein